jgi:hypothetical protein
MPVYSLAGAAAAAGRSRSTVLRAIQKGRLSAVRDATTGEWAIDASELARVYPPPADRHGDAHGDAAADGRGDATALIAAKDALISEQRETIEDLRRRLDAATAQLGAALTQVGLLTDRRPSPAGRRWRPWRWFVLAAILFAGCGPGPCRAAAGESGNVLPGGGLQPVWLYGFE